MIRQTVWRSRPQTELESTAEFCGDVQYYLTLNPRQLPSRYLYDPLGSALFDAICQLPWYGITRAEERLLTEHRHDVFARLPGISKIVELGSGSGTKLRKLVDARPARSSRLTMHLIDISEAALTASARALAELDDVTVVMHQASYEAGLDELPRDGGGAGRTLAMFLGSNIGNFDRPGAESFLREIRSALAVHDGLLIGADLVKPEPELLVAYDDPLGVTAAFNRNLLVRINRELGGDFDVAGFQHRAVWNPSESRIEMHLMATRPQHVCIDRAGLSIDFSANETIWTESSYKYSADEFVGMVERAGFVCLERWIDASHPFALMLFEGA